MFDRILVCLDGSEPARTAVQVGLQMGRAFGSEVLFLSVFNPSLLYAISAVSPGAVISSDFINVQAGEWHTYVEGVLASQLQEERPTNRILREQGNPSEKILRAAVEEKADLIILGSRGIGGFQRQLLGSTSDKVVHHAACPVMVVR